MLSPSAHGVFHRTGLKEEPTGNLGPGEGNAQLHRDKKGKSIY